MLAVPSKVILFGEYALLKGGNALGVPLSNFTGKLSYVKDRGKFAIKSQSNLNKFYTWIKNNPSLHDFINVQKLEKSVEMGLWFDSTIPLNSGLGSSGALVAAILHEFKTPNFNTLSLSYLKNVLADFESFFHGTSSGIDPLLTYLNQPILIKGQGEIQVLRKTFAEDTPEIVPFLIPTHGVGKTSELVKVFHEKCRNHAYMDSFKSEYLPINDMIINTFLTNQTSDFWDALYSLSYFQLNYFPEMIDANLETLFKDGISSQNFGLKLCGSGGGGFAVGFAKSATDLSSRFKNAILLNF